MAAGGNQKRKVMPLNSNNRNFKAPKTEPTRKLNSIALEKWFNEYVEEGKINPLKINAKPNLSSKRRNSLTNLTDKDREEGWELPKKFSKTRTNSDSHNMDTETDNLYDPLTPTGKAENTQPIEQSLTEPTAGPSNLTQNENYRG